MAGTLLVGQAGGATAVINSSLAGVIAEAQQGRWDDILGMRRAAEGALQGDFIPLSGLDAAALAALSATPGAALGSSRHRVSDDEIELLLDLFQKRDIRAFLYIGGNDSADTTHRLARHAARRGQELAAIAIPKTIDNDLPDTDHCPGYGSIARYVAIAAMDSAKDTESMPTMYPIKVIEVMGRDAGWVAAAAALGKREPQDAPHLIYLPERPVSPTRIIQDIERVYREIGRVVAVVPETLRDDRGEPFADPSLSMDVDAFGHRLLRGTADSICRMVQRDLGLRSRFDKPGSLQRMSMLLASTLDLEEAAEVGHEAVRLAAQGVSDRMVTIERLSDSPYAWRAGSTDLSRVANAQRLMPDSFIGPDGMSVTEDFRRYALPLIGPEPLPTYFRLPWREVRNVSESDVRLSKAMSHALRHAPAVYGLEPDEGGWVPVDRLVEGLRGRKAWSTVSRTDIERVVAASDKQRFELSGDRIRARYGHSLPARVQYERAEPPVTLYHGTSTEVLGRVKVDGLLPMARQYVHLSIDRETAQRVAQRKRGRNVILLIQAREAFEHGIGFYLGGDATWLAEEIPPRFIAIEEGNPR